MSECLDLSEFIIKIYFEKKHGAQRDKLRGVAVSNPITCPNLIKVNDLYKIVRIPLPAMTA